MRVKIFAFFLLLSTYVQGQTTHAVLESGNGFSNIQAQALNDSLLLTFTVPGQPANFRAFLIAPDGKQTSLILPELQEKQHIAATHSSDTLCVYYINKGKETPYALLIDKKTFSKETKVLSMPATGILKTSFADSVLTLISVNTNKSSIDFTQVSNGRTIGYKSFLIGEDAKLLPKLDAHVIEENKILSATEAVTPVKIYARKDYYYVTIEYRENKHSTCLVLKLDKASGTVTRWKITKGVREDFATFINGDKLISLTRDLDFFVTIYDIQKQQEINNFVLEKRGQLGDKPAIYRDDAGSYVATDIKVKKVIGSPGTVFVESCTDDSGLLIRLGTHQIRTPYMGFGLAGYLLFSLLSPPESLDLYFYMKWDGDGFKYVEKPAIAKQAIDEYEQKSKAMYKGYLNAAHVTYGFYKFNYDKLWITSFKH